MMFETARDAQTRKPRSFPVAIAAKAKEML